MVQRSPASYRGERRNAHRKIGALSLWRGMGHAKNRKTGQIIHRSLLHSINQADWRQANVRARY